MARVVKMNSKHHSIDYVVNYYGDKYNKWQIRRVVTGSRYVNECNKANIQVLNGEIFLHETPKTKACHTQMYKITILHLYTFFLNYTTLTIVKHCLHLPLDSRFRGFVSVIGTSWPTGSSPTRLTPGSQSCTRRARTIGSSRSSMCKNETRESMNVR